MTHSDDKDDILEDSLVIRDDSPPRDSMDVNMVFVLPSEFRAIDGVAAQLSLCLKEAIFEKPKESCQYLRSLYVKGHIDGRPISMMLVDGGATMNLM